MKALSSLKCVPCQGGIPPFSVSLARKMVQRVNGWKLAEKGKKIQKEFLFGDFAQAMKFVNKVASLAEKEGHHPDIFVSWNRVILSTFTHKINGLHENDFILAAKIDTIKA